MGVSALTKKRGVAAAVGDLFAGFDLKLARWWFDGDGPLAVGCGRTSPSVSG